MDNNCIYIKGENGTSLTAMVNDTIGWLMYQRYDGDVGLRSHNPNYSGSEEATTKYILDNGQVDEYPNSWAYPITEVNKAINYFKEHNELPSFILWYDEERIN